MNRLTGITLTGTICAVMGFASIGIAGDAAQHQSSENLDNKALHTPLNELQRGEESKIDSVDNNLSKTEGVKKSNSEFIRGTVTLVGDNMIKILDAETAMTREVKVSQKQEVELSSGYIIDAEVKNGRLVAFTKLGVPENVEDIVYTSENLPKEGIKIQMPRTWEPQS